MATVHNIKGTSVSSFRIGKGGYTITADADGYLTIADGASTEQPIGYNTIPIYEIDAADTFDLAHAGMMWHKDSGAAVTFTCDNDATIPQGSTWIVHNDDAEDITIAEGTGVTIAFLASGAAPATGNVTVEQGGIVTVYKYTDTEYWVWGDTDPFDLVATGTTTDATLRWSGTAWAENTTITATSTGILTAASTAGNHEFSVDSATTNAAIPVVRLSATSTGTPASGIGPSIEFEAETAAGAPGNQEVGGTLALEATDVTATSEDFDFVFSTMAAGAAAAERLRVTSTGEVTATTFNGVALTTGGAATNYLQEDGSYGVPAGLGNVSNTGTPLDNQVAVWTNATTIEGDANFTWTGTTLAIAGAGAQLLLPLENDAVTPTLAFGDGDTGFYELSDDTLRMAVAGVAEYQWSAAYFTGTNSSSFHCTNETASRTNATIGPHRANSGFGGVNNTELSIILTGDEVIRFIDNGTYDAILSQLPIFIAERGTADVDIAAYGQLWVKNDAPNTLQFTNDDGDDTQISPYVQTVQTTDATVTELFALAVASGTSVGFEATIMGRQDATGDTVMEKIAGLISNEAGTTAIISTPGVDRHETSGASTWTITTAADDTSDELTFDVTGEAAHTIDWRIHLTTIVI